jgi:hypothetical protein
MGISVKMRIVLTVGVAAMTAAIASAAETIADSLPGTTGVRAPAGTVVRVKVGDCLNQAVARARTLPKPVTLRLDPGVHELSDTLRLGPEDSGIVFESSPQGPAVVSGGHRVTGWRANGDGTWRADITRGRPFRQLTVNGARAIRCRHPNTGSFKAAGEEIPFDPKGSIVSAGHRRHPALVYNPKDVDFGKFYQKEICFRGSNVYTREDFEIVLQAIAEGRYCLDGYITHVFPVEKVVAAFGLMENRRENVVKILLKF